MFRRIAFVACILLLLSAAPATAASYGEVRDGPKKPTADKDDRDRDGKDKDKDGKDKDGKDKDRDGKDKDKDKDGKDKDKDDTDEDEAAIGRRDVDAQGVGGDGLLARTGSDDVVPMVQAGMVLIGGGALLALVARRRRSERSNTNDA